MFSNKNGQSIKRKAFFKTLNLVSSQILKTKIEGCSRRLVRCD